MVQWTLAITIGVVSSLHCLGMCGPIAFALPLNRTSMWSRLVGGGLYNLGRITTYAVLGLIFGLLGKSLVMAGAQRFLSIGAGVLMILSVLVPQVFHRFKLDALAYQYLGKLKSTLGGLFKKSAPEALFLIGVLNGLLPCAMVYMALAGAIAEGSIENGFWFMLFFGIGTLPMMYSAVMLGSFFKQQFRNSLQKMIPYAMVLIGLLFIIRGSNLGIPYLSPEINRVSPEVTQCD